MASYPSSVKSFSTNNDGDTIYAAIPNAIQDEVTAVEDALLNGFSHALKPAVSGAVSLGAAGARWDAIYFSGLIDGTGLGIHKLNASSAGSNIFRVRNTHAGTGSLAQLEVGNDTTAAMGKLIALSTAYTTASDLIANSVILRSEVANLIYSANHASGLHRWFINGTEHWRVASAGQLQAVSGAAAWFGDGAVGSPSIGFVNDQDTGLYWEAGGIGFSFGGTKRAYIQSDGDFEVTQDVIVTRNALITGYVDAAAQPYVVAYKTGAQTISTSWAGYTAVSFDAETADPNAFHDNVTNNTRFTVPSGLGGFYFVGATVLFEGVSGGKRGLQLLYDGTTQMTSNDYVAPATTDAIACQIFWTGFIDAAHYVELKVKQDSGSDVDVIQGATFTQFFMHKLA